MTVMKKVALLLLSLVFILSVSACSFGGGKETIRVAEVTRSIFYAPFYAAISQGYFEEEGIDLDLTRLGVETIR
ncbi:nitrate/sulfonate/taurine/bicarbonate ABC transporter [Halalkalibacter wakoensis JCM 9140]|uniref:Nitrate/sulfonate/taurine/bicarbonate ABC transporter n=1 Tax=Halalkalibacter wakoensis JCM 9140 TaxID=1236970 RepID=W4Q745_9BACI|nr:nitrate/sulfonate/taurine/bicarbonate ABC transporter [Halalkalibacter wakoensis JCM 9140]